MARLLPSMMRRVVSRWDAQEVARLASYYAKGMHKSARDDYLRYLLGDYPSLWRFIEDLDRIITKMVESGEEVTKENLLRHLPMWQ